MLTEIPTGASDVWKMAFSGDGEHLCTGGHTGKVHIYGVKSGTLDKVLDTRGKFILSVACVSINILLYLMNFNCIRLFIDLLT